MPGTPPKLTSGPDGLRSKIAACGAWKENAVFEMIWRYLETPHHDTVTCRFEGNRVRVDFMNSVSRLSARPEKRPALEGTQAGSP